GCLDKFLQFLIEDECLICRRCGVSGRSGWPRLNCEFLFGRIPNQNRLEARDLVVFRNRNVHFPFISPEMKRLSGSERESSPVLACLNGGPFWVGLNFGNCFKLSHRQGTPSVHESRAQANGRKPPGSGLSYLFDSPRVRRLLRVFWHYVHLHSRISNEP